MDELAPIPEFSPVQYLMLLVLLVVASCGNVILSWIFPALSNSVWVSLLPLLVGGYALLLLFRSLGILKLPNGAYYSAIVAPLSVLSFYQLILL